MTDNPFSLHKQTILITGASSGIGRACAFAAAKAGARIILTARNQKRLGEVKSELPGDGHLVFSRDLSTDTDAIPDWLRGEVVPNAGKLTGIVHAAGIAREIPLKIQTTKMTKDLFQLNLYAAAALAKGLRHPANHEPNASLVFVSSTVAFRGRAALSAYAASKGGLVSMARNLAVELAPDKVRVNCVLPGWVETPMTTGKSNAQALSPEQYAAIKQRHPLGLGSPHKVANATLFLLTKAAEWMTGTELVVDGGFSAT